MTLDESISFSEVNPERARRELERLLGDGRFRATERTRKILQYLANRHFEGCNDSVKAYAIAFDVLGRTSDFDPATDPIVRIEVSRLRSALTQYYEAFGDETDVAIDLPKGKYILTFTQISPEFPIDDIRSQITMTLHEARPDDIEPKLTPMVADRDEIIAPRKRVRVVLFGALLAVTVGVLGTIAWSSPPVTNRPLVVLKMSAPQPELAGDASVTRDMLMTALTQFRTLSIAARDPEGADGQRSLSNAYSIELKYYGDDTGRSVWWQIVSSETGELLKAGLERVDADGRTDLAVREEVVHVLSRRFATKRGVISTIEMQNSSANALGNVCVLRGELFLEEESPDELNGIKSCLKRTIAHDPTNSDAMATLSRVLMSQTSTISDTVVKEQAFELATRAVSLTPLSDRAQIALMVAQFLGGGTQAAISAGNRALSLNPNNPDVSAKLGLILYVSGYREGGLALANDAGRSVNAIPRDASLVLALDAYNRRDWSSASLLSEQINNGGFFFDILKVASLGELNGMESYKRLRSVRLKYPDFENKFSQLMENHRFDPELIAGIKAGLVKAGAKFNPPEILSNLYQ